MLTRANHRAGGYGLAEPFALMDEMRREMDRMFEAFERSLGVPTVGTYALDGGLALDLEDEGERFLVRAELPGVREEDVDITFDAGTLTIRARREVKAPEGLSVRRKERASYELTRSISLPVAVDAEHADATLKNGILELAVPKAPQAAPRRLTVKGSSSN